jgi:hypothetical protein
MATIRDITRDRRDVGREGSELADIGIQRWEAIGDDFKADVQLESFDLSKHLQF